MTKRAAYDDKRGRYFIAIPTISGGPEHMTIKFLGDLTGSQVDKVKLQMEDINKIQKMPLVSEGVGILGRKNLFMVNFIEDKDKRLKDLFNIFNNKKSPITPHVTSFKVKTPTPPSGYNSGGMRPMDTILADKVVLYKTLGAYKYKSVHEVVLKKRTPWTWIKDRFANWV